MYPCAVEPPLEETLNGEGTGASSQNSPQSLEEQLPKPQDLSFHRNNPVREFAPLLQSVHLDVLTERWLIWPLQGLGWLE